MAEPKQMNLNSVIKNLSIYEAKRWIGVTEKGGNNKGQIVEVFQKAVDNKASGEPWCMAFVQSCIIRASEMFDISHPLAAGVLINALHRSEHCATVWLNTDPRCRQKDPTVGSIVIWKEKGASNGHTGLVVDVNADGSFFTIEGNTSDGSGIVREGDGVFKKLRTTKGYGNMELLGFIDPWMIKKAAVEPAGQ